VAFAAGSAGLTEGRLFVGDGDAPAAGTESDGAPVAARGDDGVRPPTVSIFVR
jgi:hypothetical protein